MTLGYFSVQFNLLTPEQIKTLGSFVIKIALPAYILHALANESLSEILLPSYLMAYGGASIFIFLCAYFLYKKVFRYRLTQTAILSMGAAVSNTGLIGTAILPMLLKDNAVIYLSLTLLLENLIMITMVLMLVETGSHAQDHWSELLKRTLKNILRTPSVIAISLATIFLVFDFDLPNIADQVLMCLGNTASPLALLVMGGSLIGASIKFADIHTIVLALLKTCLMPLTVYGLFCILPNVNKEMTQAGTVIAALPMPIVFSVFGQIYGLEQKALSALMLSTIMGLLSVSVLILLWWT